MYPRELLPVLDLLYNANVPAIIWGPGGAGKSSLVRYVSEQKGVNQFDLRLATQDVGEVVGMPYVKDGIMHWSRPAWWTDEEEWILLLDEANRGERRLIQAVFQLITDRRIHTHVLPKGVRILACCNPPGEGNIVNRLDEPFLTRFAHLSFEPSVPDLMELCADQFSPDILHFLSGSEAQLMDLQSEFDVESIRKRTPRTWQYASKIYQAAEQTYGKSGRMFTTQESTVLRSAMASCIGNASALDFIQWNKEAWTRMEDIISGTKQAEDITNDSDLVRLISFMTTAETEQLLDDHPTGKDNLSKFLTTITNQRADLAVSLAARVTQEEFPNLFDTVYNNNALITAAMDAYDTEERPPAN